MTAVRRKPSLPSHLSEVGHLTNLTVHISRRISDLEVQNCHIHQRNWFKSLTQARKMAIILTESSQDVPKTRISSRFSPEFPPHRSILHNTNWHTGLPHKGVKGNCIVFVSFLVQYCWVDAQSGHCSWVSPQLRTKAPLMVRQRVLTSPSISPNTCLHTLEDVKYWGMCPNSWG